MSLPCPVCHCDAAASDATHAIVAVLARDDLDRAIELGLLTATPCEHCDPACTTTLLSARNARLRALAARDRYRARNARLQRREAERAARRAPARNADTKIPSLPPAAAAALARAKAKAAGKP